MFVTVTRKILEVTDRWLEISKRNPKHIILTCMNLWGFTCDF